MSEQFADIEGMLRRALAPVEPPDTLSMRLESTLETLTEAEPVVSSDERLAPIEESVPVEPPAVAPAFELPLPNPAPLPALADAFAALLAAEQSDAWPAAAAFWPASPAQPAAVTDELVEDVTRRVLERLSDTVVRDAVADIATKVAERLIREEIERIKASIK